ncbi:hypothetical protein D3C75_1112460 [compost metagenome]
MASCASLVAQADFTEFRIQIIIYDDHIFKLYFVIIHIGSDSFPGKIHKCHRFDEDGLNPVNHTFTDNRLAFVLIKHYAVSSRQFVQSHKADIMLRFGVLRSGISESNNPFHDGAILSFRLLGRGVPFLVQ